MSNLKKCDNEKEISAMFETLTKFPTSAANRLLIDLFKPIAEWLTYVHEKGIM